MINVDLTWTLSSKGSQQEPSSIIKLSWLEIRPILVSSAARTWVASSLAATRWSQLWGNVLIFEKPKKMWKGLCSHLIKRSLLTISSITMLRALMTTHATFTRTTSESFSRMQSCRCGPRLRKKFNPRISKHSSARWRKDIEWSRHS